MTTVLFSLTPAATLEECCQMMEKNQVRRMMVVDDRGSCVGIVAQADIARVAPENETAELVKDISKSAFATA
jgi:predicted transcriptional regulator